MVNYLNTIMRDMITRAEMNPGKIIEKELSRGLIISVKKVVGNYHLTVSRIEMQPSLKEWEIVLRSAGLKYKTPTIFKQNKKHYLMGIIER